MARPADGFAAWIDVERHAATRTQGAIDEGNRAPARRAQSVRLEEARSARHAQRRKQQVEYRMSAAARGPTGGVAYSPLHVHALTLAQDELRASTHFRRARLSTASR